VSNRGGHINVATAGILGERNIFGKSNHQIIKVTVNYIETKYLPVQRTNWDAWLCDAEKTKLAMSLPAMISLGKKTKVGHSQRS
jgi:hypothetical protein